MRQADLIAYNFSNLPEMPVYPYAFVQIKALAKRMGIGVMCRDLSFISDERAHDVIKRDIQEYSPRMIGLHLRQLDSLYIDDYRNEVVKDPRDKPFEYLPLLRTKSIIDWVRGLTDIPVVVGGFGFTVMPRRIMPFLNADYGVQGCADPFFENIEQILSGSAEDLKKIPNLVYRDGDEFIYNKRIFSSPLPEPEYDQDIFDDIINFYGFMNVHHAKTWRRVSQPTLPVEVMRGCPHGCYYCTEPFVTGRQCRYRNLDAILADVDFLVNRGIRHLWFICAEINAEGNEFFFQLSDRIKEYQCSGNIKFNWQAYYIPKLNFEEFKSVRDSGFLPGWTEFVSLDDENLAKCRVPYRAQDVIENLKHQLQVNPQGFVWLTLFLGNAFCTQSTIRRTLAMMDEHGLLNRAQIGRVVECTRVFDLGSGPTCGENGRIISLGKDLVQLEKPEFLFPSFYYSQPLVDVLGNTRNIAKMFKHLDVMLLRMLPDNGSLDWNGFLYDVLSQEEFLYILDNSDKGIIILECFNKCCGEEDADPNHRRVISKILSIVDGVVRDNDPILLKRLFRPRGTHDDGEEVVAYTNAARLLIEGMLSEKRQLILDVLNYLGISHQEGQISMSCYQLNKHINFLYPGKDALLKAVAEKLGGIHDETFIRFFLEYFLFTHHIDFKYADIFY